MSNRLLIAGLMGALAFAGGCSESKPAAVTTVAAAAPVAPAVPARDESIIATGPLVVENQVDVMAQREGMVIKTLAEPGTHVRKGQLLASLDDRQLAAELDAARAKTRATDADLKNWEAELKVVESDLERTKKMWEAQLITKEQLDHAQYKLVSDQWNVRNLKEVHAMAAASERSLELELEKTHIKAPFDGIVARRYVRQGQKVSAGDRMF